MMRFRSRNNSPLGLQLTTPRSTLYSKWRVIVLGISILSTLTIFLLLPHQHKAALLSQTDAITRHLPSTIKSFSHTQAIQNSTLGFEKIYALGLSDRSDRRDAMELAASITDLDLTWVEGVTTKTMNPKVIPPTYKMDHVLAGVTGCWRSHMNIIRAIVRDKVSSALIFEDDADWDLRIKSQMLSFATATKTLLETGNQPSAKDRAESNSPYGEGWDILWVGHCGGFQGNTTSVPHYIIDQDDTMPPHMAMDDMLFGPTPYIKWNSENDPQKPCSAHEGRDPEGKICDSPRLAPDQRIVQERAKPVCTAAYAVSYQGARKLLARVGGLSLTDVFAPVDQGFGDVCAGSTDNPGEITRCFTPSPPYFRGYKAKGLEMGDSDIRINPNAGGGEKRKSGWSKGIMQSVRLNADAEVGGGGYEPQDQYVRDGFILDERQGGGDWRLRRADEYRGYKPDVVVDHWIW